MVGTKGLKEIILDRISQIDVYSRYIGSEICPGKTIRSPLREGDNHPSFSIFRTKDNRVVFKDHAGESGDIFTFVMLMFGIGFKEACQKIAHDFNIETNPVFSKIARIKERAGLIRIKEHFKERTDVKYTQKEGYTQELVLFLESFGIDSFFFEINGGVQLEDFQIGNYKWKSDDPEDIALGFKYPSGNIRIYRPKAHQFKGAKHIGNACRSDVFGLQYAGCIMEIEERKAETDSQEFIFKADAVIICAGQKDVMSLHSFIRKMWPEKTVFCICLNSESCELEPAMFLKLKSYSDKILSCYDFDKTGMKYALKLSEQYGINPVIDQHMAISLLQSHEKDVSDLISEVQGKVPEMLRFNVRYEILKTIGPWL